MSLTFCEHRAPRCLTPLCAVALTAGRQSEKCSADPARRIHVGFASVAVSRSSMAVVA